MATKPSTQNPEYSENSIRVLKGLEPVKQRPGMYTRTDSPMHVIQEVLDNAADEALAGHGKKIKTIVHTDGSITVEDDGRGIPFGMHPTEHAPVIELVFTQLHAGGKFDKGKGGAYSFSGGLHGVGVSVTNALSLRLEATTYREGQVARLVFAGGDVIEPLSLRPAGEGDRKSGTTVRVWPDGKYFESMALPMAHLEHLLRSKAVLMPGVSVTLVQEKTKETQTWLFKGGLRDYLTQTLTGEPVIPLFEGEGFADANNDSFAEGEGAAWCVAFTEDGQPVRESYVNLIPTTGRRHARVGLARRPVHGGQEFCGNAFAVAQGRQAAARRRVCARQLCAVHQGAGPAVSGPDQGAPEFARCGAAGLQLRPARAGAVAEPERRIRQKAGRNRHQGGAKSPESRPEG